MILFNTSIQLHVDPKLIVYIDILKHGLAPWQPLTTIHNRWSISVIDRAFCKTTNREKEIKTRTNVGTKINYNPTFLSQNQAKFGCSIIESFFRLLYAINFTHALLTKYVLFALKYYDNYYESPCRQRGYYQPAPCLAFPLYHNNDLRWTEQKPGPSFCRCVSI